MSLYTAAPTVHGSSIAMISVVEHYYECKVYIVSDDSLNCFCVYCHRFAVVKSLDNAWEDDWLLKPLAPTSTF